MATHLINIHFINEISFFRAKPSHTFIIGGNVVKLRQFLHANQGIQSAFNRHANIEIYSVFKICQNLLVDLVQVRVFNKEISIPNRAFGPEQTLLSR
jgi:hypothetical protein